MDGKDFFNFPHVGSGKHQTCFQVSLLGPGESPDDTEAAGAVLQAAVAGGGFQRMPFQHSLGKGVSTARPLNPTGLSI